MQTLDVLAEWLSWRGITFSRMDGQTNPIQRELDVRDFNADGSPTKVFLISTRAGGVGINLASADVVILFDSDWNPQVDLQVRVESPPISPYLLRSPPISSDLLRELLDLPPPPRPHLEPLQPRPCCCMHCDAPDPAAACIAMPPTLLQAMDRAHRIGQKKPVRVFRLISTLTVEERIRQRAASKMLLDTTVVGATAAMEGVSPDEVGGEVEATPDSGPTTLSQDELLQLLGGGQLGTISLDLP